jgi:hypothetical protein
MILHIHAVNTTAERDCSLIAIPSCLEIDIFDQRLSFIIYLTLFG